MVKIFVGIEGGASLSKGVLVRSDGKVLATVEDAPGTNMLLLGNDVCHQRINDIVEQLLKSAKMTDQVPAGLGLCLSGCENAAESEIFGQQLQLKYPNLTKSCAIASDTVGSILTVSPGGGIVLIAGTGSNCLLLNPDGTTVRCGGWGHLLGDHSSAYWIASETVKTVLAVEDNFISCPHSIEQAKKLILDHFGVTDYNGLLQPVYTKFDKARYALLCKKLSVAAAEGDGLCLEIFRRAGYYLGRHVVAVLPRAEKALIEHPSGLCLVCCGSVFKSWSLLKEGFLDGLGGQLKQFRLVVPQGSSAIGAALLSARNLSCNLPLDFQQHGSILYEHKEGTRQTDRA